MYAVTVRGPSSYVARLTDLRVEQRDGSGDAGTVVVIAEGLAEPVSTVTIARNDTTAGNIARNLHTWMQGKPTGPSYRYRLSVTSPGGTTDELELVEGQDW